MLPIVFCLYLISYASGASLQLTAPCKIEDSECITKIAREVYAKAVAGVPELGIEKGDPIVTDIIKADLPTLKFEILDSTATGFTNCQTRNVKINKTPEKSVMEIDMLCPRLTMTGKYDIDGQIAKIPIQGKGDFEIDAKDYHLNVVADIQSLNKDGKRYIYIENPVIDTELLGDLHFELHNLFNGDKEKAEPVINFIKQYPKQTVKLLDGPVFAKNFGKLFDSFNKQLKVIPVDNLVDQE